MRKGDINNHIAEHCRLTTLTRSDEGLSDDYPALEKVHVLFFRLVRIRKLNHRICTCIQLIWKKKLTGGGGRGKMDPQAPHPHPVQLRLGIERVIVAV